ncbi:MAG: NADH-quinone oxidoreductase subunit M, partial [Candidatus Odinarchaeota archaeon]
MVLLTTILLLPVLTAGLIFLLGKRFGDNMAKYLTLAVTTIDMILSLAMVLLYMDSSTETTSGFKLLDGPAIDWIPDIGISYIIGVDGVSLTLVVLTTFIVLMAVLASWT